MVLSEKLGGFYLKLEDKWYGLLDSLDAKGIPVYAYADFFDKKGIPSFMATIVLIVLLLSLLFLFALPQALPDVSMSLKDDFGSALTGVKISIFDEKGKLVSTQFLGDNSTLDLKGIPFGMQARIKAEKEGYEPWEQTVVLNRAQDLNFILKKIINYITGSLIIIDSGSDNGIANANVIAGWGNLTTRNAVSDSAGKVALEGIPSGELVSIKISADAYEEKDTTLSFSEGQAITISLDPKSANFEGKSTLIVSIYDKDLQTLIKNSRVKLFNKSDDSIISDRLADEGQFTESLPKGTSLKLVVLADEYQNYDSTEAGEDKTLRENEETWRIYLKKGGESLNVTVLSENALPLANANVQLFDLENNLIDSNQTSFGGSIEFNGLGGKKELWITAFSTGYLHSRQKVDLIEEDSVVFKLFSVKPENSALLGIGVIDELNQPVNGANLLFYEIVDGKKLALGIPPMKTSIEGYASARIGLDLNILVKASNETLNGEGIIQIKQGFNELKIRLIKSSTMKELDILDAGGKPLNGKVKVTSQNGNVLFEGNTQNGKVYFDSIGNSTVNVDVESADGKKLSTQANLNTDAKTSVSLSGEANNGLNPEIELKRILDSRNNEVEGITRGQFYWLEFSIAWPSSAAKGGVNVRVGNDETKYVEEQEIGIYGFDAAKVKESVYGKSYHPEPAPGAEGIDRQNKGSSSNANKWLELLFENPVGEYSVKVKVKANETAAINEFEAHYRAWNVIGNRIYRTPEDKVLGDAEFNRQKSGLYANTLVEKISIFESIANCRDSLCASFSWIGENGQKFDEKNFAPSIGKNYALEITLNSRKSFDGLKLNADTSKSAPKIYFTGEQVDTFANFITSNKTDTSISIPDLSIKAGTEKKARIYFKTAGLGAGIIKFNVAGEKTVISKDLAFNIFTEKAIDVKIEPSEIVLGKDFTITATDAESRSGIGTASIRILGEKGNLLLSIIGNNTSGNGENGRYLVKNVFDLGNYTAEVSAPFYEFKKIGFAVAKTGYLQLANEVKIQINKNSKQGTGSIDLHNNSANAIQNIAFGILQDNTLADVRIDAVVPSALSKGQKSPIQIMAVYTGNASASIYGEAKISIRGMIEGKYPTVAESIIKVYYNKQFDESCIAIAVAEIQMSLIGAPGTTEKTAITVENKCGTPLVLNPKISGDNDPNLEINVSPLQLAAGESKALEISILNKILRLPDKPIQENYAITLDSDQVTTSRKLTVFITNPQLAIEYPSAITLWLNKNSPQEKATVQAAIPIRNISNYDIQNLSLTMGDDAFSKNNVYSSIISAVAGQNIMGGSLLPKGKTLDPPRQILLQTDSAKSFAAPLIGYVNVKGTANGKEITWNPIQIMVFVSGYRCLSFNKGLSFASGNSNYGTLEEVIAVTNNCSEELIIRDLKPNRFGQNVLGLVPLQGQVVPPNANANFKVLLEKRQDMDNTKLNQSIVLLGFGPKSGKWVESAPMNIQIALGEKAEETGMATGQISIPKCGKNENMELQFPKISEGDNADCSLGYCDAKSMAAYILGKANEQIKNAKTKIIQMNYEAQNFPGCGNSSVCHFSAMGVNSKIITAFMQNDSMTMRVLKNGIDSGKFGELGGFRAEISNAEIGSIAGTGYARQLLMSSNAMGCGKYVFKIDGAVQVSSNRIMPESIVIKVDVEPRKSTPECLNKIQNLANFLPLDSGFTSSNDYGSWLGQIESEEKTMDIAKAFSNTLFGTDKRVSLNASAYNRLKLGVGSVEGGIVKFSIEQKGQSDAPKTIYATINDAYVAEKEKTGSGLKAEPKGAGKIELQGTANTSAGATTNSTGTTAGVTNTATPLNTAQNPGQQASSPPAQNEPETAGQADDSSNNSPADSQDSTATAEPQTTRELIAAEAATALAELVQHQADGCISEDESYLVLKSFSKLGQLKLDGPDKTTLGTSENCIDLSVSSEFSEKIKLKTDWDPKNPEKAITGIESIVLRNSKGTEIGKLSGEKLELNPAKKGQYAYSFKFCAKGNNQFAEAINSKVTVWAESIAIGEKAENIRKSNLKTISFEACGIHPYDLVKKLQDLNNGTYYATVGWKDSGDTAAIDEVIKALNRQKELDKIIATNGTPMGIQGKFKEFWANEKSKAVMLGYLPACTAAAAVCGGITKLGPWGSALDTLMSCVIPSAVVMADLFESTKKAKDALGGQWNSLVEKLGFKKGEGPEAPDLSQLDSDGAPIEATEMITEVMGAAKTDIYVLTALRALGTGAKTVNKATASILAHDISSQIAKSSDFTDFFRDAPSGIKSRFTAQIKSRLEKRLLDSAGKPLTEDLVKGALQDSVEKSAGDLGRNLARSSGSTFNAAAEYKRLASAKAAAYADATELGSLTTKFTGTGVTQATVDTEVRRLTTAVTNKIVQKAAADGVTLNRATIEAAVRIDLTHATSGIVPAGVAVADVGVVNSTLETAVETAARNTSVVSHIETSVGSKIGPELVAAAKLAEAEAGVSGKLTRWQQFRRLVLTPKNWGNMLKGAATGLACGFAEMGAGYGGYLVYANNFMKTQPENLMEINGGTPSAVESIDTDGDNVPDTLVGGDNGPIEFKKNQAYKITVSNIGGKRIVNIVPVNGDGMVKEMNDLLKSGKASRLDLDSCKGEFAQKDLTILNGSFNPTLEKGAAAEEIKMYSDPKVQKPLVDAADKLGLDEGLLVAVLFAKQPEILANFEENIKAEAQKLKDLIPESEKDSKTVLQKYAKIEGLNAQKLIDIYNRWQKFRIKALPAAAPETPTTPTIPPTTGGTSYVPQGKIQTLIVAAAKKYGVPADIALAVAQQESGMRQFNSSGSVIRSSSGCIGVMQVCSNSMCSMTKKDMEDLEKNIDCGVKILKAKYDQFKNKIPQPYYGQCPAYQKYTGWDAGIRAYNTLACDRSADLQYVEKVNALRKKFS